MTETRESLSKSIEELQTTALALFDEIATNGDQANTTHINKASALRRLLSVNQREVRTKLSELKAQLKTKKETTQ